MKRVIGPVLAAAALAGAAEAQGASCGGELKTVGAQKVIALAGGGAAVRAKMNINIDGSGRAYNIANAAAGALIHLCNAGEVFLADGTSYQGSESNATCSGKFMDDVARIKAAGWKDPTVGVVRWFGILGVGEAVVAGRTIRGVEPVDLADGFFVSPTTLGDPAFADTDQKRYPDPLVVPGGVMPNRQALKDAGVRMGGLGVAIDTRRPEAAPVPFIVNDYGPRIGEGSVALARLVSGREPKPDLTRAERFVGQVDTPDVLWVYFGGEALGPPYSAERVKIEAQAAFAAWGGPERLKACATETASQGAR
jgi:hypothetical protein